MTTPDWEDLDGDSTPTGEDENKSFKELRNYAKKLEREQKAVTTELEELRAFRQEVVTKQVDDTLGNTFKEVGLPETHAKLFKALNPELTPDAITTEAVITFAKEYQLISADVPDPEPKKEGFTPVQVGQPAGLKTYTPEEIQALLRAGNMDEVNRAVKEGRVEKPPAPWVR